jgi:hypothetical protein
MMAIELEMVTYQVLTKKSNLFKTHDYLKFVLRSTSNHTPLKTYVSI